MRIDLAAKFPESFEGRELERRIIENLGPLATAHDIIEPKNRGNIQLKDKNGATHKYESFDQIERMYREGFVHFLYEGPESSDAYLLENFPQPSDLPPV